MTLHLKLASAVATGVLTLGAVVIGGGTPLSPGEIADAAQAAARNSETAAENAVRTERSTRAVADIAQNVRSQLDSSERLLEIQLALEASSRQGADRAVSLERDIEAIGDGLRVLQRAAEALSGASRAAGRQVVTLADSATDLERQLAELGQRFDSVVEESRELNRKARGFDQIRDPLP